MANGKGVICNQSEIRVAYNNISRYIDFLGRMYAEYTEVMSDLMECGFVSPAVNSAISQITNEATACTGPNESVAMIKLKLTINGFFNSIKNLDDFVYPSNMMDDIRGALSMFL